MKLDLIGCCCRLALGGISALPVVVFHSSAVKAQSCDTPADCLVVGAECVDGSCRLALDSLLIPALVAQPLRLRSPGNLAMVPRGTFDVEFEFPAGARHTAILIMKRWPEYEPRGRLTNEEDLVWYWDSAWENGTQNKVQYKQGKVFREADSECKSVQAPALERGTYHWAAIAWDAAGSVSHQSEVRSFTVGPEAITGRHCDSSDECRSSASSSCYYTQQYCALSCASDRDCFAGTHCDLSTRDVPGFAAGVCRSDDGQCNCGEGEFCDDSGEGALRVCFEVREAALGGDGCDCGGSGSKSSSPATCFQALLMLGLDASLRKRRRRMTEKEGRGDG
jgi:hypothetical protein